jgi:hypothetical protein
LKFLFKNLKIWFNNWKLVKNNFCEFSFLCMSMNFLNQISLKITKIKKCHRTIILSIWPLGVKAKIKKINSRCILKNIFFMCMFWNFQSVFVKTKISFDW